MRRLLPLLPALALLGACAGSRAPRGRVAEAQALGRGGPEAEAPLRGLLRDPQPAVRAEAALGLFRLRFLERVPAYSTATARALRVALSDPAPAPRRAAAHAFSRYAEPSAALLLAQSLDGDPDLWTRVFAARALGLLGKEAPWEELVRALRSPEPALRLEAVRALGEAGRAEYLPDRIYKDPSAHVRAAAAEALRRTGDRKLAYRLDDVDAMDSPLALGEVLLAEPVLRPARAAAVLGEAREDPRWWVRSRAYLALAGLPGSAKVLAAGLGDPDPRVAAAAVEALAKDAPAEFERLAPALLASTATPVEVLGAVVEGAGRRPPPALAGPVLEAARARVDRVPPPYPLPASPPRPARVLLETDKGELELELAVKEAPTHCAAFLALVRRGAYDGLIWHRVVPGFVVQGGDPRGSGWGDHGFSLKDELNPLPFERGTLGMPKAGPDTGGGQLFITLAPAPHLDGRYTAFGRVVRGMEAADRLEPGDRIRRARASAPK